MVYRPWSIFLAATLGSAIGLTQPVPSVGNAMLDSTRTPSPAALTAEQRGDIMMARKQYREAIEAFSEGNPKDPILKNKTGIAYHQLLKLDQAQKCYEQAIKLKPNYHEAVNNLGT